MIDEAQDMSNEAMRLVRALAAKNTAMRVVVVGDDDQCIFEYAGANPANFGAFQETPGASLYQMTENYRSARHIVAFANQFVCSIAHRMKSEPILAMSEDDGEVTITESVMSANLEESLVAALCRKRETMPQASFAVLTNTNREALVVAGLLKREGVEAVLIGELGGFRFRDLAEVRFFLKCLQEGHESTKISDELWSASLNALERQFAESAVCVAVVRALQAFDRHVDGQRYVTDLEEFLNDCQYSDFVRSESSTAVSVMTIHKAKGREFDCVFMLLTGSARTMTDAERRKLYVGFTRARFCLSIHTNTEIFHPYRALSEVTYVLDQTKHEAAREIVLELGLDDVVLDAMRGRRAEIGALRSGMPLSVDREGATYGCPRRNRVCTSQPSRRLREALAEYAKAGYRPKQAEVAFVVHWHPVGTQASVEHLVVLPRITLARG